MIIRIEVMKIKWIVEKLKSKAVFPLKNTNKTPVICNLDTPLIRSMKTEITKAQASTKGASQRMPASAHPSAPRVVRGHTPQTVMFLNSAAQSESINYTHTSKIKWVTRPIL